VIDIHRAGHDMTIIEKPRACHLVWLRPRAVDLSSKIYGEAMQRYILTENWQTKCKWCSCFGALPLKSSQKKFN
jgi:hypothetical protein